MDQYIWAILFKVGLFLLSVIGNLLISISISPFEVDFFVYEVVLRKKNVFPHKKEYLHSLIIKEMQMKTMHYHVFAYQIGSD